MLLLGSVAKDMQLRNMARAGSISANGDANSLMRRMEDPALTEGILAAFFLVLTVLVQTDLWRSMGLQLATAVVLASSFAFVISLISLAVTLSRARRLLPRDKS